jgi:hypothetical protein
MGQAKINQAVAFAPEFINDWEASDCVNFAVALSRLTGWLLEVDWWSPPAERSGETPVSQLKPIRVHVADNGDKIFDVRGIRTVVDYKKSILDRRIGTDPGGIDTRYHEEAELPSLPLRIQPDEDGIARALEAIRANRNFLAAIPTRPQPCLPAYQAATFSFGHCAPFAEALRDKIGLQPVGILATRFLPGFGARDSDESGYFHSVVLHPDGMAEDSWGKAPLKEIASRFSVLEFNVNAKKHQSVSETLRRNSSDAYEKALEEAKGLIRVYRT